MEVRFMSFLKQFLATVVCISAGGAAFAQDLPVDTSITFKKMFFAITPVKNNANKVPLEIVQKAPYISLQQILKGNAAGVFVQERSGEPGADQSSIFIRGLSMPLLKKADLSSTQPAVFVNGIPLIMHNPFGYDVTNYDYNNIGTSTNLLSTIDIDNIESIEIYKNPADLAALGPLAANGAIWITTKNAKAAERLVTFNAYVGFQPKPTVATLNANSEDQFRKPYYEKYGSIADKMAYPTYLSDRTDRSYYGPSNWSDLYYNNAPLYNANISVTGGSERANFRFYGASTSNKNVADEAQFNRYQGFFAVNMLPLKWLTVRSSINATKMDRKSNRYLRDRFAVTGFIPDFSAPLAPNKNDYAYYLKELGKSVDNNSLNSLQGSFNLSARLGKLGLSSGLLIDYNEGTRESFYASTIGQGNNYVDAYFGYNQRLQFNNAATYDLKLDQNSNLNFKAGFDYTTDVSKYNLTTGYNTPNDFIKVTLDGGINTGSKIKDNMVHNMLSFYGMANYTYKDYLTASFTLREDASSYIQPDNRWLLAPSGSVDFDMTKAFGWATDKMNNLTFSGSYGKLGRYEINDRFSQGPHYMAGVYRPYQQGWVGYDQSWGYSKQFNTGIRSSWLDNRLNVDVDYYSKNDKNMLFAVPVVAESGYTTRYLNGLNVQNTGVDVLINMAVLKAEKAVTWNSQLNFNFNHNELKDLPGGLNEIVVGERKLEVGKSIDQFWLLQNKGIYSSDASATGMTYNGVSLKAGDANWADLNGDKDINNTDKTLIGHAMPTITGGFTNTFKYKKFDLSFQFYFALGQKALNERNATRLDFINSENNGTMSSVKEITYWQKDGDLTKYPLYNPWSNVIPYRLDQDLFLDNASFVKLRHLSVGYDITNVSFVKKMDLFKKLNVYVSGTNLLTFTSFKGKDPELVDFNGYYTGYGLPLSPAFTFGIRAEF